MTHLKRHFFLALFAAGTLIGGAHAATLEGSGKSATETRALGTFQSISVRDGIDIVVRQGSSEGVQVRADDNLLPMVQTVVEGSGEARSLRIRFKPGESLRTRSPVVVTVDVIKLTALASSGSGNISVEALKTPALALSISGSSDAKLHQLDTDQFNISIAGSGDVHASGRATRLEVSIAGSGEVRTRELASSDVSVSIAGSGDASVAAQKSISVSIAGSGDVEYVGAATLAKSRIAGSGTVRQRQP
ncbi:MAG: head GIN domain-containing protein [Pseudomonadota bacterium]